MLAFSRMSGLGSVRPSDAGSIRCPFNRASGNVEVHRVDSGDAPERVT